MSLNAILDQTNLSDFSILLMLINEHYPSWRGASTLDDRQAIENRVVALFEDMLEEPLLREVSPGYHPEMMELAQHHQGVELHTKTTLAKLTRLRGLYQEYFYDKQSTLAQIQGQVKRIRQMLSALGLWNREGVKYLISEAFTNYDDLATDMSSKQEMHLDFNEGILTLPVIQKEAMPVRSVAVGSGSNGFAGNSDIEVDLTIADPKYIFDGDENTWFEYERLDSGPLKLDLVCELALPSVVNRIEIDPLANPFGSGYVIRDIRFSTNGIDYRSIDELRVFDNRNESLSLADTKDAWSVTFLPIQCKNIVISFEQDSAYPVFTSSDNKGRARNRYMVGLRKIAFQRVRYSIEGGINSKQQDIPAGSYAADTSLTITPKNKEFYDCSVDLTFDNGSSWHSADSTVLMSGDETALHWRFEVTANPDAFDSITGFDVGFNSHPDVKSQLRTVSRFNSPNVLNINGKPNIESLYVYQPKLMSRGDRTKGVRLSATNIAGDFYVFELPVSILDADLIEDRAWLSINGKNLYQFKPDSSHNLSDISEPVWTFSQDYRSIWVSYTSANNPTSPTSWNAQFGLYPEELLVAERSDGYYHYMGMAFDPDISNIDVEAYSSKLSSHSVVVPPNVRVFKLPHDNIYPNNIELRLSDGTVLDETTTFSDMFPDTSTTDDYYVDTQNGVLYLKNALDTSQGYLFYRHQQRIKIDSDALSVFYEDNKPMGIRVARDAVGAQQYTVTLSDALDLAFGYEYLDSSTEISDGTDQFFGIRTGPKFSTRSDDIPNNTKARLLTHKCLVKGSFVPSSNLLNSTLPPEELPYIDGFSEFEGVIPMYDEQTIALETDSLTSYVEFYLNARELYVSDLGVHFANTSVFSNKVSSAVAAQTGSVGDYYVSVEGLVTINIGVSSTLTAGIDIQYYYRNPTFDKSNKFSVDYRRGIIYAGVDLNTAATVSYKTLCGFVSYDVVKELTDFQYTALTNSVEVKTENLHPINSLVKMAWLEEKEDPAFQTLKNYFSPIVDSLSVRFN